MRDRHLRCSRGVSGDGWSDEQSDTDHDEGQELWEWQSATERGVLAEQQNRCNDQDDRSPSG